MFLRRIFKGMPDLGPWVAVAELSAAVLGIAATLMALDIVPSPFSGGAAGSVSGTVTDANTGKPVPEATVQIVDPASSVIAAEAVPDEAGKWKETVKPGSYTVKAVCDGYRPMGKTVSVAEGKTRIVRLTIVPQPKEAPQEAATAGRTPIRTVETRIIVDKSSSDDGTSTRAEPTAASAESRAPSKSEAQTHLQKALDLQAKGDIKGAIKEAEKAVSLDPEDGKIYRLLYALEVENGNNAAAGDWARDGKEYATKNRSSLP